MHQCLSCDRLCDTSSAFCDACRVSWLEGRAERAQDEQSGSEQMQGESGEKEAEGMPLPVPELALAEPQVKQQSSAPLVQDDLRSLETTSVYNADVVDGMDEQRSKTGVAQVTNVLAVPPPPRRVMPRRVRRALLVFCVVGALALLTDSLLLALSIMRHHAQPIAGRNSQSVISAQVISTPPPATRQAIPTPSAQPTTAYTLSLSSSHLAFNAIKGQANLTPQTVVLSASNSTAFSWQVAPVDVLPAWLSLSAMRGKVAAGETANLVVGVQPATLEPGTYTANLLIKAFDNRGKALVGSPGPLTVTLGVHPPCVLNVSPSKLDFTALLVSAPTPQTLTLAESAGCSFPVYWQVSADASWVTFSSSSGIDMESGNAIIVQASSANKLIGSYTAHITLQAIDSSGTPVAVSPASITVTLTVIG